MLTRNSIRKNSQCMDSFLEIVNNLKINQEDLLKDDLDNFSDSSQESQDNDTIDEDEDDNSQGTNKEQDKINQKGINLLQ